MPRKSRAGIKRGTNAHRWPYVVKLPTDATSPTGSIYGRYDIVQQSKALQVVNNSLMLGRTIRSAEPFILTFVTKGRTRVVVAKREA